MKVQLLSETAKCPIRGDDGAAGYDLYASEALSLSPWSRSLIKTDVALEMPSHVYGRIAPRSSMGVKGLDIGAGVVDPSYRGEIKVVLINSTNNFFDVKIGDRVAQIIFTPFHTFDIEIASTLSETTRGQAGFGSTGQ